MVNLHSVSEVRPEVVRDISISLYQLELFSLSENERNIFFWFALRFVVGYLCPVKSRRQDCSRKVKDG